ncbi:glycosyltransferase family 4 protein [Psychroflexus sp. CAK1W]|uniref:glycosyltransferase family 4 protein n=1 Tax=Psychroflexus curvus TaxID=2873595 RepID=UPI001CCA5BD6|nr:glycosyltransferase family 4 protein [Psychroflexus curvus]MBZ9628915.1 glycosyltransferase family 4 protein [Psychroflexus curvus]
MSKKNIAVICNYRLEASRVGGMDHFFWQFNARCKEQGIVVDWFFPNPGMHGDYSSFSLYADETVAVEQLFLNHLQNQPPSYSHIITHFTELCTPFYKKLKKHSNARVIAVDHNPRPLKGYTFKKKVGKRLKGLLYSRYIDVFVGVSEYTRRELLRDFGSHIASKTRVIYNGVLVDAIEVREKRNHIQPTFLVASHLRKSKGIQDLIAAVAMLPESVRDSLVIDVYGDGPYKSILLEQAESLDVTQNFRFKGSHSHLNTVFRQYDYLLHPTHMECFSLTLLESLAANVPVITTNVGGNEEVVVSGKNGYIYKAKEVNELREILINLWEGNYEFDLNTRKLINEKFSIDNMVSEHFKLVQTI